MYNCQYNISAWKHIIIWKSLSLFSFLFFSSSQPVSGLGFWDIILYTHCYFGIPTTEWEIFTNGRMLQGTTMLLIWNVFLWNSERSWIFDKFEWEHHSLGGYTFIVTRDLNTLQTINYIELHIRFYQYYIVLWQECWANNLHTTHIQDQIQEGRFEQYLKVKKKYVPQIVVNCECYETLLSIYITDNDDNNTLYPLHHSSHHSMVDLKLGLRNTNDVIHISDNDALHIFPLLLLLCSGQIVWNCII